MIAYDKGKFSKIPTVLGIDKWQAMKAPLKLLTAGLVVLVLGLGYWFLFRSHKSGGEPKYNQGIVGSGVGTQPEIPVVPEPKSLKAGGETDWIFIMKRQIVILPNDDSVTYTFKDVYGKERTLTSKQLKGSISESNGRRNLADMTQFARIKTEKDIIYFVEKW